MIGMCLVTLDVINPHPHIDGSPSRAVIVTVFGSTYAITACAYSVIRVLELVTDVCRIAFEGHG